MKLILISMTALLSALSSFASSELPLSAYHQYNAHQGEERIGTVRITKRNADSSIKSELKCDGYFSASIPFIDLPSPTMVTTFRYDNCVDGGTSLSALSHPQYGLMLSIDLASIRSQETSCQDTFGTYVKKKICVTGNRVSIHSYGSDAYAEQLDYDFQTGYARVLYSEMDNLTIEGNFKL